MSESKNKEITGNPAIGRKPPSNVKDLSPLLRGSRSFDDYSSTSDEYIKEMTKAFNQRFVVEGGKCKCSEGTKEASIKATRVTSTTFGKACALTFSCTKMMEEEIFGKCRKLTFEKADKEGKSMFDISPVMCKDHYNPTPNKWKDPASTVGDNGEDIILLTSTLKCEHGGRIAITSNGQGGKLKDSLGNMWFDQAARGSYSEYDTIGGSILGGLMRINPWFNFFAAGRDFQHGYYNLDGDEMASALLGVIPTFKAISLSGALPKLKDLKKLLKKDGSKKAEGRAVVEEVVEEASGANVVKPNVGVVQSRINIANGPTRFSSSENAGFNHILDRHFNPNRNAGQFTISQDKLKDILSSKNTVNIPVKEIPGNQFERIVDIGETAGIIKPSIPDVGGTPTNYIRVITDKAGNLITTYPIPKP